MPGAHSTGLLGHFEWPHDRRLGLPWPLVGRCRDVKGPCKAPTAAQPRIETPVRPRIRQRTVFVSLFVNLKPIFVTTHCLSISSSEKIHSPSSAHPTSLIVFAWDELDGCGEDEGVHVSSTETVTMRAESWANTEADFFQTLLKRPRTRSEISTNSMLNCARIAPDFCETA